MGMFKDVSFNKWIETLKDMQNDTGFILEFTAINMYLLIAIHSNNNLICTRHSAEP